VALRVARRARAQELRRRVREKSLEGEGPAAPERQGHELELIGALHDEVDRLPETFRKPVVLCCLEELTYVEAARRLGVSEPTLRGRLHRARRRLETRLRARGLAPEAILPLWAVPGRCLLQVPPALVEGTIQLASKWQTLGRLVVGTGSTTVHLLAQGVVSAMLWNTVKIATIPAVVAASILGTAVLARQESGKRQDQAGPAGQGTPARDFFKVSSAQTKQAGEGTPKGVSYDQLKALEALRKAEVEARTKQLVELANRQQLDKKSEHIRDLLSQKYDLVVPKGATLEEFLKAVKEATSTETDPGIPIYVNPTGLEDAGVALMQDVVVKAGDTLADAFQRALKPLKLWFDVHDGMLVIDSRLGLVESRLQRVEQKLDRLMGSLESKPPRP
jgi:hypothetical protein